MRKYGKAFIFLRRPERWCFEFLKGESKRALWVLILAWETLELWPTKILKFAFILLDLLQKKVLRLSPFSNQMDSLISDYQRTDCTNSHYTYHLKSQPGKRQPYTRGALSFMPYGEMWSDLMTNVLGRFLLPWSAKGDKTIFFWKKKKNGTAGQSDNG